MVQEAPCLPWMALRLGTGREASLCAPRRQDASALQVPPLVERGPPPEPMWLPLRALALPVRAASEAHTLRHPCFPCQSLPN